MSEDSIKVDGKVIELLSNGIYKVELDANKHIIHATIRGKMRLHNIRILPGDAVTLEISPYNLKEGRIIYRKK